MASNIDGKAESPRRRLLREIQEEFDRLYIHEGLNFAEAVTITGLNVATIRAFLGRRRDGYQTKNPKSETLAAMADLVGYDMQFVHRGTGKVFKPTGRKRIRKRRN